jgi:5-methylthioribose kinase
MVFLLSSRNVFDYLVQEKVCEQQDYALEEVESKISRNFNLLVTLKSGRKLLIKQESYPQEGKISDEFLNEWQMHEFVHIREKSGFLRSLTTEIVHFDAEQGILISEYLSDYHDLADFYAQENTFPTTIPALVGTTLSVIHRSTFGNCDYQDFFSRNPSLIKQFDPSLMMRIGPEIFGSISSEGLKFFILFQRYDSLRAAITEVLGSFTPCCLTHNDLKPANILLHVNWEDNLDSSPIRFIDWEFCAWGDPAYDLGLIIAGYLKIWLSSLVISSSINITEALRYAVTPLEYLQPSMTEVIKAYLSKFPEILEYEPQLLRKVMQFSGLALVQEVQTSVQNQEPFGNTDICMLQVAKALLCNPEQSVSTIFGLSELELTHQLTPLG